MYDRRMAIGPFVSHTPPGVWGPTWAFKGPDPSMKPDLGRKDKRHQFKDGKCTQCGCEFNVQFGRDPTREQLEIWGLGLTCEEAITHSVMGA